MAVPIPTAIPSVPAVLPATAAEVTNNIPIQSIDLQVLEQVQSFYNNAWMMLIVTGTLVIAAIAFIGPYLMDQHQKKMLKLEEDRIKKELKEYMDGISQAIIKDIEVAKNELNTIKQKSIEKNNSILGGLMHVQANYYFSLGNLSFATACYLGAFHHFLNGKDINNANVAFECLLTDCIPKSKQLDINQIYSVLGRSNIYSTEKLLSSLTKSDVNKQFTKQINVIAETLKAVAATNDNSTK